jgi:hypothetical protein
VSEQRAMIPAQALRICAAEQLQPGQFAFLHEFDHAPAIVGKVHQHTVAVVLDGDLAKVHSRETTDLSGAATVIQNWEAELDYTSVERLDLMDDRAGALVIQRNSLAIAATPPSGRGYVVAAVAELDHDGGTVQYGFSRWRAVYRDGLREHVLFEKCEGGRA